MGLRRPGADVVDHTLSAAAVALLSLMPCILFAGRVPFCWAAPHASA